MRRLITALAVSLLFGIGSLWLMTPELASQEMLAALGRISVGWVVLLIGTVVGWWLVAAARLRYLAHCTGERLGWWGSIQTHVVGVFSSAITPAGGGNSVGIALVLMRLGLAAENAIAVTVMSLVGDMVFFAWSVPLFFTLLLRRGIDVPIPNALVVIVIVSGFGLLASYLLAFRLDLATRLLRSIFRLRLFRRFQRRSHRFLRDLEVASERFSRSRWHWHLGFHLLSTASRVIFFAVLNLVLMALGVTFSHLAVFGTQLLVHSLAFVIPTPGASGYQEAAIFYALKGNITAPLLAAAVILWRLCNYYLYFVAGPLAGGTVLLRQQAPSSLPGIEASGRADDPQQDAP